jgi:hypothetical protein
MYKGISRIDSAAKRQHSWLARYRAADRIITKQFSDKSYGGKAKSLRAAQRWLEAQRRIHPPGRSLEEFPPFQLQPVRSNTGIRGISRTHDYARHDRSIKQECFSVAYSEDGKRGCAKFYLHHYDSEEEALAAAVEFRRQKEQAMVDAWRREQANARQVEPPPHLGRL